MPTSPDLSLIVPAYREAERIGETLDAIVSYLAQGPYAFEVIVAVDGTDATRDQAERRARADPRILVTGSAARRGKGRAVREAGALARGRLVGYLDADGKTPIEELAKLLPYLEDGWDAAVGSRALPQSQVARRPPLRRLGSAALAVIARRLLGLRELRDAQCGFKLFRGEVARELFAAQRIDGYLFDLELLMLARARGYRVREVAIRWLGDTDSRFHPITAGHRVLAELARLALQRLRADAVGAPPRRSSAASTRSAASR